MLFDKLPSFLWKSIQAKTTDEDLLLLKDRWNNMKDNRQQDMLCEILKEKQAEVDSLEKFILTHYAE